MNPSRRRRALAIFFCFVACSVQAGEKHDAALIEELLKLPAPPPDWRQQLAQRTTKTDAPPPDAPLETLAEFWQDAPARPAPERRVQTRLLEACEAQPEKLTSLLRWFPTDAPDFHDRVKAIFDKLFARLAAEPAQEKILSPAYEWLQTNSRYFREELVENTRKEFAGTNGDAIARSMQTLARLDPPAAEKLLLSLAESGDLFTRTAALVWLHSIHSANQDDARLAAWRTDLQRIAADVSAPARARDYAVTGVMRSPWPGQDDWYLGLFADASLGELRDDSTVMSPLCAVAHENPDRWIPKIAPLIGGANRAAHNNAARCLIMERADALRPLLPWLSDAKWADIADEAARRRVVYNLAHLDLPECVPGLIRMLEQDNELFIVAAAEALRHYGAKEAGPALRKALGGKMENYNRSTLLHAALALGAFSTDEMERAIKAFLAKLSTEKGQHELEDANTVFAQQPLDPQVSVGLELWPMPIDNEELAARLLRRARELAATQPQTAERLRVIVAGWSGTAAIEGIAQRLKAGDLARPWVVQVLTRRNELAPFVEKIDGLHGFALGLQVTIVGGEKRFDEVLHGSDRTAKLALLACARLARVTLPFATVEPLLDSKDALLARAAARYLVNEDTPAARAVVLRKHPGEALILGAFAGFCLYEGEGHPAEKQIREWLQRADGPREIFALLTSGVWGDDGQRLLLAYADKAVLRCFDGGGRERKRLLAPAELEKLRAWLTAQRADDLAPFDQGAMDGLQLEYVHVSRDGGRRVFMNNPPSGNRNFSRVEIGGRASDPDPRIYGQLVGQFTALSDAPMDVSYATLHDLPGFRLLHARERGKATALVFDDGKLLVQTAASDEFHSDAWHVLGKDGLSADEAAPPASFRQDAQIERWPGFSVEDRWLTGPCTGRLAGKYVWPGTRKKDDLPGLWIAAENAAPELLARGTFAQPVVTPDGEWIVVAQASGTNWAAPNSVVRIHVADQHALPVGLPAADTFAPVAWLPVHGKILLHRERDRFNRPGEKATGPQRPEFHLLDPASGKLTKVTGEFRPLLQASTLPRPPTANASEVWAIMPSPEHEPRATTMGRYDTRTFTFKPVLKIPGVAFSSADLRINEPTHALVFIVNGDVLRLSLPQ